ncbi:MAG TPA: cytochrome c biogenesis protein CcdA [Haloplasmataceae bacterium]
MRKFLIFFIMISIFTILNINTVSAEISSKTIVYLYSDEKQIDGEKLNEIASKGISIQKINVLKLDNKKYFYKYQYVYNITDDFINPIIIAGNDYYVIDNNNIDVNDIVVKAQYPLKSIENVSFRMVVYFDSGCSECQIKNKYVDDLEDRGVKVVKVDTLIKENENLFYNYADTYQYTKKFLSIRITYPTPPMIFVGSKYFHSDDIIKYQDEIYDLSINPLLDVKYEEVNFSEFEGFWGFFLILLGGLIDGVNPCAMAMLILFVGIVLGSNTKKSTLINIAISYISGLFITYFLLGVVLIRFLSVIRPYTTSLSTILNIFIIIFSLFFFIFNLHDFLVTRKKEYQKVKNQLPKGIQKLNKKLIKLFTEKMKNKNLIIVYFISFTLAVIIAFTEFLCTGQIYLPILLMISETSGVMGIIKLLLYNIMFVVPLIILAFVTIKARSAMETSNVIREKMHIIKLLSSILFLGLAVYYIFIMLGMI